jgi:hypothetical protein
MIGCPILAFAFGRCSDQRPSFGDPLGDRLDTHNMYDLT